jgi:hypothetical protein
MVNWLFGFSFFLPYRVQHASETRVSSVLFYLSPLTGKPWQEISC